MPQKLHTCTTLFFLNMAYATLLSSDNYLPGAVVLGQRLKTLDSSRDRLCLVTKAVSGHIKQELGKYWTSVVLVDDILPYNDSSRAAQTLLGRPELGTTLAKIAVWSLTQYKAVLFLDSDVLPLKDISVLFKVAEANNNGKPVLVASPDVGWPDVFNSGVFCTVPNETVYVHLVDLAQKGVSFDGGDQGLLNEYFQEINPFVSADASGTWVRAPFTFNVPANGAGVGSGVGSGVGGSGVGGSGAAGYEPAYNRFKGDVSAVHFLGPGNKPWMTSSVNDYHVQWNRAYNELYPYVKPSELAGSLLSKRTIGADINRWDARTMPPPARGVGEAVKLQQSDFKNVWDEQSKTVQQKAPKKHVEPALPPIFPWESKKRVVTRVFDDYVVPPDAEFVPEVIEDEEDEYEYVEDDILEVDEVDDIVEGMSFSLQDVSEDDDEYTSGKRRIAYPVTPFASIRGRRPTGLPGITPAFEDDEEEEGQVVNDIRMRRTSEDEYGSTDEWDPSVKLEELRKASDRLSGAQTSFVPDDI